MQNKEHNAKAVAIGLGAGCLLVLAAPWMAAMLWRYFDFVAQFF